MENLCSCGNNCPDCDYCGEAICECECKIYGRDTEDDEMDETIEEEDDDTNW